MHRILFTSVEAGAAAVFLIPIYYCLNRYKFRSISTTIAAFFFSLYLCTVYAMVGLPNITYVRFHPNFNYIPFRYFFSDISSLLNVILFIPLGLFLPVLRSRFQKTGFTVLFGFLMSLFIEFFQIFTMRASDINDLITNTVGTILGFFLGRFLLRYCPSLTLSEERNELKTICVTALTVMFFLQPFLSKLVWKFIL